jgi:hypothetical protein
MPHGKSRVIFSLLDEFEVLPDDMPGDLCRVVDEVRIVSSQEVRFEPMVILEVAVDSSLEAPISKLLKHHALSLPSGGAS